MDATSPSEEIIRALRPSRADAGRTPNDGTWSGAELSQICRRRARMRTGFASGRSSGQEAGLARPLTKRARAADCSEAVRYLVDAVQNVARWCEGFVTRRIGRPHDVVVRRGGRTGQRRVGGKPPSRKARRRARRAERKGRHAEAITRRGVICSRWKTRALPVSMVPRHRGRTRGLPAPPEGDPRPGSRAADDVERVLRRARRSGWRPSSAGKPDSVDPTVANSRSVIERWIGLAAVARRRGQKFRELARALAPALGSDAARRRHGDGVVPRSPAATPLVLQQAVEHAQVEGAVRAAALQREVTGFGPGSA